MHQPQKRVDAFFDLKENDESDVLIHLWDKTSWQDMPSSKYWIWVCHRSVKVLRCVMCVLTLFQSYSSWSAYAFTFHVRNVYVSSQMCRISSFGPSRIWTQTWDMFLMMRRKVILLVAAGSYAYEIVLKKKFCHETISIYFVLLAMLRMIKCENAEACTSLRVLNSVHTSQKYNVKTSF